VSGLKEGAVGELVERTPRKKKGAVCRKTFKAQTLERKKRRCTDRLLGRGNLKEGVM
jgi:hypothetical protein